MRNTYRVDGPAALHIHAYILHSKNEVLYQPDDRIRMGHHNVRMLPGSLMVKVESYGGSRTTERFLFTRLKSLISVPSKW